MLQFLQKLLLAIYQLFKKTGLLETDWFKRLFWKAYFAYKQYFEDPFYDLTQKYPQLFKGGNVLDIGANIGYTASVFARSLDPDFKVYAFEPDRTNFLSLREIARGREVTGKIVPIQAAVGETWGTADLWYNEAHHGDHRILTPTYEKSGVPQTQVSSVPMWSIDSFVLEHLAGENVSFIKIDVQGYELPVCRGMERTLAANPDAIIALEYSPSAMSELGFVPETVLTLFEDWGYFAYLLQKRDELTVARRDVLAKLVEKRGYVDLIFSKIPLLKTG